jgi:DNA ligase-1
MHSEFISLVIEQPHADLIHKEKNVDIWIEPRKVWEVRCADITVSTKYCASINTLHDKGLALRFPRFLRAREDKNAKDATTSNQLFDFYHGI